jgi:hypothetical protein
MTGPTDLLAGGVRFGLGVGRQAARPLTGAVAAGQRIGVGLALDTLDAVLASAAAEAAADRVLANPWTERTLTEALGGPLADRLIEEAAERFVASPEFEQLVAFAVESPAIERAVADVFKSRLLDQVVSALLASPDLWRLVDEIARSPSVTEAITHQGFGFADQVAGEVRDRSRTADATVENAMRRLLRRRSRMDPPTAPIPDTGAP